MLRSLCVVVLFATGCGPVAPDEYKTLCMDMPVFGVVLSAGPLDCDEMRSELLLAKRMLTEDTWTTGAGAKIKIMREADLGTFRTVRLTVLDVDSWDVDGAHAAGQYVLGRGIFLARGRWGLVHEMLHHWDAIHLAAGTAGHWNWDWNGHGEVAYEYRWAVAH